MGEDSACGRHQGKSRSRPGCHRLDQWSCAALAGAGIGLPLASASTDAVNRSRNASYGEVTGITRTVRSQAAAAGLAVFGTVLTHITTENVVETLRSRGCRTPRRGRPPPPSPRRSPTARTSPDQPGQPVAERRGHRRTAMRDWMDAVRMDFAEANQWVFHGTAIALGIGFLCALRHPGTRVTEETRKPRRVPANR